MNWKIDFLTTIFNKDLSIAGTENFREITNGWYPTCWSRSGEYGWIKNRAPLIVSSRWRESK